MLKEQMIQRKAASPVVSAREMPTASTVLWLLAAVAAALLLPRARLYGALSPFGVGLAAAVSGSGTPLLYVAAITGYVWVFGPGEALRYVAAVVMIAGVRWALGGIGRLRESGWFAPLLAGVSVWFSGTVTLALGHSVSVYALVLTVCEGAAAGAFAVFCRNVTGPLRNGGVTTTGQLASLCAVGAVLLSTVAGFEIGGVSPGRMLGALLVLLLARSGRESGGAIAGVVLGSVMALLDPTRLYLCAVYAFGGLMAGLFSRFGRFSAALVFTATAAVFSLGGAEPAIALCSLYEAAAGALVFAVLPPRFDRRIHDFVTRGREMPAVESFRRSVMMRLDCASRAMQEVAGTVDAVSGKLASVSAPDLGSVYRQAADTVCRTCGLRLFCWETHFDDTMDSLNHLTPALRERGRVTSADVEGQLSRRCGRLPLMTERISGGYEEHLLRESAWRRLSEIRGVLTGQFAGVGDMLRELSGTLAVKRRMDADTGERVRTVCEAYGMLVSDAVCFLDERGHMTVEVLTGDGGLRLPEKTWVREISEACGRPMEPPVHTALGNCVRLTLREQPRYRVSIGTAQLVCPGETLCGDAVEHFWDDNGCFVTVLSDGMGSGGRAAVDGAMAAGLTARLMQAGFGDDSVLSMVNSALMVKSGDESLSTLDVLRLDLYSGQMESLKAGAAASLLFSHGRISRLEQASLPVGILREVAFERQQDTLTEGDVLLLVSDGVYQSGSAWVEQLLQQTDPALPTEQLAALVAEEARKRQEKGHEDDITVAALRLCRVRS